MNEIKVNGRRYWFEHLANLKRISRSRWTVERRGVQFQIEGGRHAGGTSREWFVDGPEWNGSINTTSLVDSLKLLEGL